MLKLTDSGGDISSPTPKKSKIESLKEESGLTDEAIGTLRTAKAKKKKIRKDKAAKPDEQGMSGDAQTTPSDSKKSKLAKNLKAYVLFVGNIPYHVTKEDIEKHFLRTGMLFRSFSFAKMFWQLTQLIFKVFVTVNIPRS